MKTFKMIIVALMAVLATAACGNGTADLGTGTTLPSVGDVTDNPELEAAAEQVQSDMEELAQQIESSQAADELQSEWTELQAEIESVIASVMSDGEVDTSGLETAMDDFQTDLEAAGDELDDELMAAWTSLRTQIMQLTN